MDITSKHSAGDDRILILIPAYQEGAQIGTVVREALPFGLPVLVVDDGSTDCTASNAADAGAIVIRKERNSGKGVALRTGFCWALERGYDAILMLDGDGQHDPAEIPLFLQAYTESGDDLIIGVRNFDDMPWTRRTMNVLGRWTLTWILGEPMHDNQSGYRLLSRRLAAACLESTEKGYEFEVDMIVIRKQLGYSQGWVPIRTIYNGQPSHINHVAHVFNYLRLLVRVRQQLQAAGRR